MAAANNSEPSVQLLHDCVDELFALQAQVRADQQKFILESATLIKASQQPLSEAVEWVSKARQAAYHSEQAAKEANNHAALYEADARFWQRLTFWTGLGFFATGVLLALVMWLMGQRYAEQQNARVQLAPAARHHLMRE